MRRAPRARRFPKTLGRRPPLCQDAIAVNVKGRYGPSFLSGLCMCRDSPTSCFRAGGESPKQAASSFLGAPKGRRGQPWPPVPSQLYSQWKRKPLLASASVELSTLQPLATDVHVPAREASASESRSNVLPPEERVCDRGGAVPFTGGGKLFAELLA